MDSLLGIVGRKGKNRIPFTTSEKEEIRMQFAQYGKKWSRYRLKNRSLFSIRNYVKIPTGQAELGLNVSPPISNSAAYHNIADTMKIVSYGLLFGDEKVSVGTKRAIEETIVSQAQKKVKISTEVLENAEVSKAVDDGNDELDDGNEELDGENEELDDKSTK